MAIEVVRSEEELRTGVRRRATARVIVRTRVVTEDVVVTVPVRKQVVEIEHLPVDGGDHDVLATADLGPDVIEVVLHEERPVVTKEVVAVERVRVIRDSAISEEQVDEVVQREVVEAHGA